MVARAVETCWQLLLTGTCIHACHYWLENRDLIVPGCVLLDENIMDFMHVHVRNLLCRMGQGHIGNLIFGPML